MKRYTVLGIFSLVIYFSLFAPGFLYGQGFTGPSAVGGVVFPNQPGQPVLIPYITTVAEARTLPNDSFVFLNGNIINALPGGKYYTFRDASGEIAVDIGLKHWRGLSIDVSDIVEIYGEVKISRGQASVKVHALAGTGRTNVRPGQPVMVNHPITIAEARTLPHDSFVILNGNIVNSLSGKKDYTLRDISGEITVEIDTKHWRGLSVGVADRIEIYGEVKISKGQASIKVHAIKMM